MVVGGVGGPRAQQPVPVFQNLAEHYSKGAHVLKLYGNSNDDCKQLFKDRLLTRVTPTFFFFKSGAFLARFLPCNACRKPLCWHTEDLDD